MAAVVTGPALLGLATLIVPAPQRDRAAEEWAADLRGCAEVGIPSGAVAAGALRAALVARRRALLGTAARVLQRSRAVLLGILLGTACALADVPVLVVVLVAGVLQVPLLLSAASERRPSATRSRLRHGD
jgi:hypothetical protein